MMDSNDNDDEDDEGGDERNANTTDQACITCQGFHLCYLIQPSLQP